MTSATEVAPESTAPGLPSSEVFDPDAEVSACERSPNRRLLVVATDGAVGSAIVLAVGRPATRPRLAAVLAAVPAVSLFRLGTSWLPVVPGWAAFAWLRRTDRL